MATQLILPSLTMYLNDTTYGSRAPKLQIPGVTLTQTTVGFFGGILSIGTSEEDITFTDVTTPRRLCMLNMDTTNFVKYGPKSAGSMVEFGRLYPDSSFASFDLGPSGVTLRMVADTADCKVLFWLAEK
jgi:hypothetical protein